MLLIYLFRFKMRNNTLFLQTVMDDEIFDSIMQSDRRLGELVVKSEYDDDAERYLAILKKFKKHMKSLVVLSFPIFCDALSEFLNEALGVEKLVLLEKCKRSFAPKQQFTKLKHLELFNFPESEAILEKITNNTLEVLKVVSTGFLATSKIEGLESFVARQKKLKILELPRFLKMNLDHLVLEQLETSLTDDGELAEVLQNQHALKRLIGYSRVGKRGFEELCKMPNLELLEAHFNEDVTGELTKIEKLGIYQSWFLLPRLAFPNLKELMVLGGYASPTPELCQALRRSSPLLQHLVFSHCMNNFLPAVIENFPTLKTLYLEAMYTSNAFVAPSRENLSLEELIILDPDWNDPMETICETINACPNLKRVQLGGVPLLKHQILGLLQHHPHLTHFRFERSGRHLFDESNSESGTVDPVLKKIIHIFKNSPAFVSLTFSYIIDWRVEDFLDGVADQIVVARKKGEGWQGRNIQLQLVKKSKSQDPFKNFHKKKELRKEEDWEYLY